MKIKEECKRCKKLAVSCEGTEYFHNKEHYECIKDWERFKNGFLGTRFTNKQQDEPLFIPIMPYW